MIQKYLDENVLLIPDVVYQEKDNYQFNWIIDKKVRLNGHTAIHSFDRPGIHEIQLKVVNEITLASSVYINIINVADKEQKYVSPYVNNTVTGFGVGPFGIQEFGV